MQRAVHIFPIDEWEARSPFVEKIWRARSVPHPAFISVAASHWEIVFWTLAGCSRVTLRGPETVAMSVPIPADAEFLGVRFRTGAFMPDVPLDALVDRDLTLPAGLGNTFRLNGAAWEIPRYDTAEAFVDRLARAGLIVTDPVVAAALRGRLAGVSQRSVERRVRRATGLTLGTIRQIERANRAAELLDRGASIGDTVERAGYADQAHLTRSMRRFIGQSPGEIVRAARQVASFSFKTGKGSGD